MFCYKCGYENPDEAAFCIKCGTKFGDMIEKIKSNKDIIHENVYSKTFSMGSFTISFDEERGFRTGLLAKYYSLKPTYREKMIEYFDSIDDFDELHGVGTDKMIDNLVGSIISIAVDDLIDHGIFEYDASLLKKTYMSKYNSLRHGLDEFEDEWARVDQYKKTKIAEHNEAEAQKEYERALNRSHWQGGGFGIKGAIKGAVTASVLNKVGDIAYKMTAPKPKKFDFSQIDVLKKKIFETNSGAIILVETVQSFIEEVGDLVYRLCCEKMGYKYCMIAPEEKINAIMLNCMKSYKKNGQQSIVTEQLAKEVANNPYAPIFYYFALMGDKELTDLFRSIAEYAGVSDLFDICETNFWNNQDESIKKTETSIKKLNVLTIEEYRNHINKVNELVKNNKYSDLYQLTLEKDGFVEWVIFNSLGELINSKNKACYTETKSKIESYLSELNEYGLYTSFYWFLSLLIAQGDDFSEFAYSRIEMIEKYNLKEVLDLKNPAFLYELSEENNNQETKDYLMFLACMGDFVTEESSARISFLEYTYRTTLNVKVEYLDRKSIEEYLRYIVELNKKQHKELKKLGAESKDNIVIHTESDLFKKVAELIVGRSADELLKICVDENNGYEFLVDEKETELNSFRIREIHDKLYKKNSKSEYGIEDDGKRYLLIHNENKDNKSRLDTIITNSFIAYYIDNKLRRKVLLNELPGNQLFELTKIKGHEAVYVGGYETFTIDNPIVLAYICSNYISQNPKGTPIEVNFAEKPTYPVQTKTEKTVDLIISAIIIIVFIILSIKLVSCVMNYPVDDSDDTNQVVMQEEKPTVTSVVKEENNIIPTSRITPTITVEKQEEELPTVDELINEDKTRGFESDSFYEVYTDCIIADLLSGNPFDVNDEYYSNAMDEEGYYLFYWDPNVSAWFSCFYFQEDDFYAFYDYLFDNDYQYGKGW